MADRTILHCDLNSFFASVELLDYPQLRDRPVAVCGDPEARHGIILAKNEAAKAYGVQTAETVWQARKNVPEAVAAVYKRYTKEDLVVPTASVPELLELLSGTAEADGLEAIV